MFPCHIKSSILCLVFELIVYWWHGRTVFYGQYKCSGPGANYIGRVSWSRELTDEEAKPFISLSFIDGTEWIKLWFYSKTKNQDSDAPHHHFVRSQFSLENIPNLKNNVILLPIKSDPSFESFFSSIASSFLKFMQLSRRTPKAKQYMHIYKHKACVHICMHTRSSTKP